MSKYKLLLLLPLVAACDAKPQPISYGSDSCHFCKMTIVDRHHAAQLVTVKGKPFKYDAIECMMNHLAKWDQPEVKLRLVANFEEPGDLMDATQARFLISQSIPSPMGAFLSAFEDEASRQSYVNNGDRTLDWKELQQEFNLPENQ